MEVSIQVQHPVSSAKITTLAKINSNQNFSTAFMQLTNRLTRMQRCAPFVVHTMSKATSRKTWTGSAVSTNIARSGTTLYVRILQLKSTKRSKTQTGSARQNAKENTLLKNDKEKKDLYKK